MTYTSPDEEIVEKVMLKQDCPRVKMEVGLSEGVMFKFRRVQDLVSQKKRLFADIEITMNAMIDDYLKRHDPVEKAKRQKLRGKLKSNLEQSLRKGVGKSNIKEFPRKALSAALKHEVYLKYDGQCANVDDDGKRCKSKRFLEVHHIRPVSQGGANELENLMLLCSGHHAVVHQG